MNDPLPFLVANFKANKNWAKIEDWLNLVGQKAAKFSGTVIVCPSAPFIASLSAKIKAEGLNLKVGSQDLSQFPQGSYTGEFAADQITGLAAYSIIGHSERRLHFKETENMLSVKVQNAQKAQIQPIYCIQDQNTAIPQGAFIVAYEPLFAVGTGSPDTPQNAQNVASQIKSKGPYTVLYGGSVTPQNAKSFLEGRDISGLLIGKSSLNPQTFCEIIQKV